MPNDSTQITIAYQTKKNLKAGKVKLPVLIDIKNGPKYAVN